jgi:hypothetical protein
MVPIHRKRGCAPSEREIQSLMKLERTQRMPQACCIEVRDEEVCDTRSSEGAKVRRQAGTVRSRMTGCSQVSIDVVAVRLVSQLCGENQQSMYHDWGFLKLERQAKTRTTQQSAPKSIPIATRSLTALAGSQKMSPEQRKQREQRVLTGNVSRLLWSNTNSPISLTSSSIEVLCGACARTVCSYSGLYNSRPMDELDGNTEEENESRR